MQLPAASAVTVLLLLPLRLHAAELVLNVTGLPEAPPVAPRVALAAPTCNAGAAAKLMFWAVLGKKVKLLLTFGAAL